MKTAILLVVGLLAGLGRMSAESALADTAYITVFFSKDIAMGPMALNKARVYVDGVGRRLPGDRFFTVALPPGKHLVSSGAKMLIARREEREFDLKAGQHIFILESFEIGQLRGRLTLRTVPCSDMEGRNLQAKLKPIKETDGIVQETSFPVCR